MQELRATYRGRSDSALEAFRGKPTIEINSRLNEAVPHQRLSMDHKKLLASNSPTADCKRSLFLVPVSEDLYVVLKIRGNNDVECFVLF